MPARPYREPAQIPPDPAPDPPTEAERLGEPRTVHTPPPLHEALVGPIVITGLLTLFGVLGWVMLLPVAAITFVVLAWTPLSMRGTSITVHARGLVVSRRRSRFAVVFEDVNEVWFEIDRYQTHSGPCLGALRIVGYDGEAHRVPLAVRGGSLVADSIFKGCSGPLLMEARRALVAGETLTFGGIGLDRTGVTIDGATSAWSQIRRAGVESGGVYLQRRIPFLWRSVRLDRIPNPTVFVSLVADGLPQLKYRDQLFTPLGEVVPTRALGGDTSNATALRRTIYGAILCLGGIWISVATYSGGLTGLSLFAIGPILFGAHRFYQGLKGLSSGSRR